MVPHHWCGTLHQPAPKAAGPDCITPRILKTCASQQSAGTSVQHLYKLSLSQQKVAMLWVFTAAWFQAPRSQGHQTRQTTDQSPSHLVTKVLESLVLAQLWPRVRRLLDPWQFAYQPHLGVSDAVIYLLQQDICNLDGRNALFDFSSGFNTIQPLILDEKLLGMCVDNATISWIIHYLTGRLQFVRLGSVLSDVVVSDTGALQGTVLSPFLFTFYTVWLSHLCFNVSGYYFHASINIKT